MQQNELYKLWNNMIPTFFLFRMAHMATCDIIVNGFKYSKRSDTNLKSRILGAIQVEIQALI